MDKDGKIKVLIIDDYNMVREELTALLETFPEFEVVSAGRDGRMAVTLCRMYQPDVVLMDLHMSHMDGVEATRLIRTEFPSIQVVVLSMSMDPDLIYDVLQAGAIGYLSKSGPISQVPIALSNAYYGTSIATQAPAVKNQSLILFTGAPDTKEQYTIVRNRYDIFESMMQFVYKRYNIETQLCILDGVAWGEFNTSCKFERDAVVIDTRSWTYDRVIAFTYEPDKGAVLLNKIPPEWMSEPGAAAYNPQALIDRDAPLLYRLQTVWSNVQ